MFTFYEVGGKVRDELLGLKSKDVDYTAVPNEFLLKQELTAEQMFDELVKYLAEAKFNIFLITKECYTIRAMFPEGHQYSGVADFVMARKEIGYIKGTRTPIVVPGTLYDDLERRDFTVNALAKDSNDKIIDFFGGLEDLKNKILRTPLPCEETFNDDPLRILRAIRFAITKNFSISDDIYDTLCNYDYFKMKVVSKERIYEELKKMFEYDTPKNMELLWEDYPELFCYIFHNLNIKLKPVLC